MKNNVNKKISMIQKWDIKNENTQFKMVQSVKVLKNKIAIKKTTQSYPNQPIKLDNYNDS